MNCRWAWDQSPVWRNSAPLNWCCCHCKRVQLNAVALWWPWLDSGIYCGTPGCDKKMNSESHNPIEILFVRTCKHSDVRAFPQQSSPFSCRVKHSNRLCSSLRRQPFHVSRALLDVAHVFWHFGVIASEQHNRPDHSEPRAMAVNGRKKGNQKSSDFDSEFQNDVANWVRHLFFQKIFTAKRVVHASPKIRLDRWAIAFDVSDANVFSIEIRGQIHQRQLQIVWRKYWIEILQFILIALNAFLPTKWILLCECWKNQRKNVKMSH